MKFHLETKRLILRLFRMSDLEPFQEYRSDPVVAAYQGWEAPYPRAKAEAFILDLLHRRELVSTEWLQIAIERKQDGRMIGDCAFHLSNGDALQAEIGYTLAHPYWGNGYTAEAVTSLLAFLFQDSGMHRVTAACDELNTASARLLERVGMRREGHFIESIFFKGSYGSEYLYAILAKEWENRHEIV